MQKLLVGNVPFYPKFLGQCDRAGAKSPIFACSASAVTASDKSSIITNRKSTARFPMSPRWTSYVVPKPPKGGSKTQSVQNLNNKLRYLRNPAARALCDSWATCSCCGQFVLYCCDFIFFLLLFQVASSMGGMPFLTNCHACELLYCMIFCSCLSGQ